MRNEPPCCSLNSNTLTPGRRCQDPINCVMGNLRTSTDLSGNPCQLRWSTQHWHAVYSWESGSITGSLCHKNDNRHAGVSSDQSCHGEPRLHREGCHRRKESLLWTQAHLNSESGAHGKTSREQLVESPLPRVAVTDNGCPGAKAFLFRLQNGSSLRIDRPSDTSHNVRHRFDICLCSMEVHNAGTQHVPPVHNGVGDEGLPPTLQPL